MNTENKSLKHQIYSSILNDIIMGVYSSDQVINEKGLMERFNVSRAPIREALIELCNEEVLYSIPYYGYKITPITQEDLDQAKEYRCIIECYFMKENWNKFTPAVIDNLIKLNEASGSMETVSDALTHWKENIDFHLALFDVYGNHIGYQNLRSAISFQTRAYAQSRWEQLHSYLYCETPDMHRMILDAIRNNDSEQAVEYLRKDILSF